MSPTSRRKRRICIDDLHHFDGYRMTDERIAELLDVNVSSLQQARRRAALVAELEDGLDDTEVAA
jgi:hypothetical protein